MSGHANALRMHADNLDAGGYGQTATVVRRAADEIDRLRELVANAVPLIESLTDVGGVSAESMAWLQHARATA